MFKKSILYLFLSLASLVNAQTNALLDSLVHQTLQSHNIPGLTACILDQDTALFGLDGTTKINGKSPIQLHQKFHLGSNTKAITSFMAMQYVEKDKISLETLFYELFPELKDSANPEYHQITLLDLLSHHAGIQPFNTGYEFVQLPRLDGSLSQQRHQFAKHVFQQKKRKPGTYSNAGYVLASMMIEQVGDTTFEAEILQCLKAMDIEASIGFPNKFDVANPWGHWIEDDTFIPLGPDHYYHLSDFMAAAGDISVNMPDYAKFIQLHLQGLNGHSNLLSDSSYRSLHYLYDGYALGWGNTEIQGKKVSFHDGTAGTYFCHTIVSPKDNMAVMIMANSGLVSHIKAIHALREEIIKHRNELLPEY